MSDMSLQIKNKTKQKENRGQTLGDTVLVIFDITYNFERGIYKTYFLCDFIEMFMYDTCL